MRALWRDDGMLMTKTLYRRALSLRCRSPETTASRFVEALGEAASAGYVRAQLRLARQARSRKEFDFWPRYSNAFWPPAPRMKRRRSRLRPRMRRHRHRPPSP
jgi:hypothetical protein